MISSFFKAPKEGTLEYKVKKTFENPPTLQSDRLLLVKIEPRYAEDMFEYSSDDEVTKYLTWSSHSSLKETERYIKLLQKKYAAGVFNDWGLIYKENGKFIGTTGFTSFDYQENTAEIGYVLSRSYHGMGLAVEAALTVMKFGIEEFGLSGFCAKCMQGNDASLRVMQKCKMTMEGIYRNSMFIKGEYKTIIVCRADSSRIMEALTQRGMTV